MPPRPPRAPNRTTLIDALGAETFDVLVIGGGITGCGIARDAALRGLRVALVEKDDFASGTSSRSSRLVHGGLRYLEHGHLHLVFEASAERRRLLRLAPHLVRPLEFVWPVYAGARVPRWKLSAGLALYDALALFRNVGAHRPLAADAVTAREPALRRDGLLGGARYFDATTDDARLTLANAIGALEAGAVVVNHARACGAALDPGAVSTVQITDAIDGRRVEVRALVVVNATGPWSDSVRGTLESSPPGERERATVRGSKGVHVAVPRERLGNHGALTLLSPRDGRVMFILPAGAPGLSLVGTTDTDTRDSPDEVRATEADVAYLLDSANDFFPGARLTTRDVVGAWAGIRPLVSASSGDSVSVSREHAVSRSDAGLVSVTGGKLTTYRVMAEDVLRVAGRALTERMLARPTRRAPLPGAARLDVALANAEAARETGDAEIGRHLVHAYGNRWTDVWATITRAADGRERVNPGLPYTAGELRYAAQHELACTLGDLLLRRTRLAFETREHGMREALVAADCVAAVLGWDRPRRELEIRRYAEEVERVFTVEAGTAGDRGAASGSGDGRRVVGQPESS